MAMSVLLCALALVFLSSVFGDYWDERKKFLSHEEAMFLGSQLRLSGKEIIVNDILMEVKNKEYMKCFESEKTTFPPARHFFEAKEDIELSEVFKIIQAMPKGGNLHGHSAALASTEYLIKNITYRDDLYACEDSSKTFHLHFFDQPDGSCNWTLVSDMRSQAENISDFDVWLTTKLTLVVPNPKETYPDVNAVWKAFQSIFPISNNLIRYRPVFEDHLYQVLTEFHQDNVMYLEIRSSFRNVYYLNGTIMSVHDVATLFNDIVEKYTRENPGFFGVKVIYAPRRDASREKTAKSIDVYNSLREAHPNFVVGFDLVGQEEKKPLTEFVHEFQEMLVNGTRFFFHAGETNWHGTATDENLIDAILLNATRIGHGFALTKHPLAMKMIKQRGIAIEINPLSNQVLLLVEDLRNHPAAMLMADNYPLVIGSDDPSFWGARGLSYDMYAAFMGFGGLHADLRTLKQLAVNSLTYSALSADEKASAMHLWETQWDAFLTVIETDYRGSNNCTSSN